MIQDCPTSSPGSYIVPIPLYFQDLNFCTYTKYRIQAGFFRQSPLFNRAMFSTLVAPGLSSDPKLSKTLNPLNFLRAGRVWREPVQKYGILSIPTTLVHVDCWKCRKAFLTTSSARLNFQIFGVLFLRFFDLSYYSLEYISFWGCLTM